MALVDQEQLADHDCVRVYIAGRLREARRVEQVLTDHGVDYYVEMERFERRLFGVIRREYTGVAFYVPATSADACRARLRDAGLRAGLEEDVTG
jgi:hypothetical protein